MPSTAYQKKIRKERSLSPDSRMKQMAEKITEQAENAKKERGERDASLKKERCDWNVEKDTIFVELYSEQLQLAGNTVDCASLKNAQWNSLRVEFNRRTGCGYTNQQLQSRLKDLKKKYLDVTKLIGFSGFGWNDDEKIVTASNEVWEALLVEYPKFRPYRTKPLQLYDELRDMFTGTHATGQFSSSAVDDVSGSGSDSGNRDDDSGGENLVFVDVVGGPVVGGTHTAWRVQDDNMSARSVASDDG